jgi:hypothetical protein
MSTDADLFKHMYSSAVIHCIKAENGNMHTIIFSLQFWQEKRNSNVHGAKKGSDMEVPMWCVW